MKDRRSSLLFGTRGALGALAAIAALGLPAYPGNGSTAQAAVRPRIGPATRHTATTTPVIQRFAPLHLRGGSVELVWATSHATRVTLNGRLVAARGVLKLRRSARSAVYLLIAGNGKRRVFRSVRVTPTAFEHRGRSVTSHKRRHHAVVRRRHRGASVTPHGKRHGRSFTAHGQSHGVSRHQAPTPATATTTATGQSNGTAPSGTLSGGAAGTLPRATSTTSTTSPSDTPTVTSTPPAAPTAPGASSTSVPSSPTATPTSTTAPSATAAQATHTPSPSATGAAATTVPDNGGSGDVPPGPPTATPELGSGELLLTGLIPTIGVLWRRRRRRASSGADRPTE